MLFPQYKNQKSTQVNLENAAVKLQKTLGYQNNPFLCPETCQALISQIHKKLQIAFSYGGWMENRKTLWSGSYLDHDQKYLHLGVDYNVPESTEVACPWPAKVIRTDHDDDQNGGWGSRVFLKPLKPHLPHFIFAHLSKNIAARAGQILQAGEIIGTVGHPEINGGWFSHLHIQAITRAEYKRVLDIGINHLDGYGHSQDQSQLTKKFPNPAKYISLE